MSHLLFWPTTTYFYPVGNTSAICLTESLSPETEADILLLACGDPRHILYTIYANESDPLPLRNIDITCCDVDAAVLARNALLFTFLADDGVQDRLDRLWNLFYDMSVDQRTLSMLFDQCRKLVPLAESTETWRAGPYGHFLTMCDAATLAQLRRVWTAYLDVASLSPRQAKLFEQRFRNGIRDVLCRLADGGTTTAARSAGPLAPHAYPVLTGHFSTYWSSGVVGADGTRGSHKSRSKGQTRRPVLTANPTFAFSIDGDKFSVHYGTDPLSGFHLAEAFASGKASYLNACIPSREVVRVAKGQFSRWCTSVSERLRRTSPSSSSFVVRMYAGDALLFCHALKYCQTTGSPVTPYDVAAWRLSTATLDGHHYGRDARSPAPLSFNVIDTSNALDHIGLINLLVAAVPLLRRTPSATMYTEALLRKGDDPSQAILEHVCGDLPAMALLLGVIPSTFISRFATRSNLYETLAVSDSTRQYHERLAWKAIGLGGPTARQQRLCFAPNDLADFLFRVYRQMFANEDDLSYLHLLSLLSPDGMAQVLQRSGTLHYNHRSFALLVRLAKTRVRTDWHCAMERFEHLVLTDGDLTVGQHAYQELACELHLLGVYTTPWITHPSMLHAPRRDAPGLFRDWTRARIPECVTIALVVPREAMACLEPDFKGTPVLQCVMYDEQRQVWFTVISATFGTLSVSGVGENRVGIVVEGCAGAGASAMKPLWRTGAPLIVTFSVLSSFLVSFARTPRTTVGLALRPTMGVSARFADRLGPDLTVYRTLLVDAERVFVLARRPAVGMRAPGTVPVDHWQENVGQHEPSANGSNTSQQDVHVQMNNAICAVQSLTVRIDVADPGARASLADPKTIPTIVSSTGSPRSLVAFVKIRTYACMARFPLPVDVMRAKLRVARRSSYIEVVAPLASSSIRPEHDLLSRLLCLSPAPYDGGSPTMGSIHHLNLDRCPQLKLPKTLPALNWFDIHMALMFSSPERDHVLRTTDPSTRTLDVLVHVKKTLHLLLRGAAGAADPGGRKNPERVFALCDASPRGSTYLYVVVACMRFDVGSHTVVADAFVAPGTPAVQAMLDVAMHETYTSMSANDLERHGWPTRPDDVGMRYLRTGADEAAAWFHLLPRLAERCRTWLHTATCEYRALSKNHRLDSSRADGDGRGVWEGGRSPLCDCGKGVATGVLPKPFERVAPYLTRVALGPFFSVPYLAEVSVPADDGPGVEMTEKETGKETGMGTSRKSEPIAVGSRCRSCVKEGRLVCGRCKGARYCSVECQHTDWKAHRRDCSRCTLAEAHHGSDLA